ncbi:hypothetical protein [Fusobacterium russii]|uniref:hypothetical protein n=1 Tax=Fusobacterium russii TaxID=854 RepID=UPI0003A588C3|nr:hypothetical protein [Fusobacterium russii]
MKRIIFLFIMILTLTNCKSIDIWSKYYSFPTTQKEREINKRIGFYGNVQDTSDLKSFLNYISMYEQKESTNEGIKILEPEIVIEGDKKYIIKNLDKDANIEVYEQGIRINNDMFTVHIGKVQLENGEIIDLPPIKFKRYVYVYKINNFLDALNQNTREDLFEGTIVTSS